MSTANHAMLTKYTNDVFNNHCSYMEGGRLLWTAGSVGVTVFLVWTETNGISCNPSKCKEYTYMRGATAITIH